MTGLAIGTATVLATAGLATALLLAGFGAARDHAGGRDGPVWSVRRVAQADRVAVDPA